jgi:Undecaprenyl-phosphate galactose phosphotransferase WbaP
MQRDVSLGSVLVPRAIVREHEGRQVLVDRPRPRVTATLLILSDVLALLLAGVLAQGGWLLINPAIDGAIFASLWPNLSLFLVGYLFASLYGLGLGPVEELKRLTYVSTGVFGIVLMSLFVVGILDIHSRGMLLLFFLLILVLVPLVRAALRLVAAKRSWWGTPVVILGAAKTGELVIKNLLNNPELGLKPVACFDDDPALTNQALYGVPVIGSLERVPELAESWGVLHAVVAMPGVTSERLQEIVRLYTQVFPYLTFVPNFFGLSSLGLATREYAGVLGIQARQNLLMASNRRLKRFMDILLVLPLIVIALPLVLVAAFLIMLISPGNPLYAQQRIGYGGRLFKVWKLRTMYQNADQLLERHLTNHPEERVEWERYFKLSKDPRILPVIGWFLRKTSIDELPQLWNIIQGEMSFVGPRPFPAYHLAAFSNDFQQTRASVIPGLTGLWQVSARSEGDLQVQEQLDRYYIRNWSLWMDIYVLWRTPWAVLFGRGAR